MIWKIFLCFVLCTLAQCVKSLDTGANRKIKVFSTTKKNPDFFIPEEVGFSDKKEASAVTGSLNIAVKHQTIIGFGGTISDATGINLNKAPTTVREKILNVLFGDDGIGLNLCRVPIGGTPFSKRAYTLDDHRGDTTLKQFALQEEDLVEKVYSYKIM